MRARLVPCKDEADSFVLRKGVLSVASLSPPWAGLGQQLGSWAWGCQQDQTFTKLQSGFAAIEKDTVLLSGEES